MRNLLLEKKVRKLAKDLTVRDHQDSTMKAVLNTTVENVGLKLMMPKRTAMMALSKLSMKRESAGKKEEAAVEDVEEVDTTEALEKTVNIRASVAVSLVRINLNHLPKHNLLQLLNQYQKRKLLLSQLHQLSSLVGEIISSEEFDFSRDAAIYSHYNTTIYFQLIIILSLNSL